MAAGGVVSGVVQRASLAFDEEPVRAVGVRDPPAPASSEADGAGDDLL